MKKLIVYACGHQDIVDLFGSNEEREKKIAYYGSINCPECRKVAEAEAAKQAGLPELTGTAKQVAWATTIRKETIKAVENMLAGMKDTDGTGARILTALKEKTSAGWWIDNRNTRTQMIMRAIWKEIQ